MPEPAQKCKSMLFKQTFTLSQFIALKMSYSFYFNYRGYLYFLDYPRKSFITLTSQVQVKHTNYLEGGHQPPPTS